MIKKGLSLLLLLLAFDVAAGPSDEIAGLLTSQQAAWNRGDLDAYMQGYWHDPKLRFVSKGQFCYGWEEMLARYKAHYPDRTTQGELKFSQLDIRLLGKDVALVVGRWELARIKDKPSGAFTLLIEKLDDRWVITHDHSSD
ncbi:SgcJ/EcaC family oxidoreductase [Shewanella sp. AS16]|uniref:YybH family protein n=1 Tax=Shewanella sp. AS16 TaxID=2907625 RepID=UPI001F40FCAD|nr:SgcJ/EcaC family oxidoreductase [Shewanella sp. AS16]MCE9687898.1 SgcJ/EcaC family oxidoreductase [Shewanella sp. AS16]